jgi:hypothetical protein
MPEAPVLRTERLVLSPLAEPDCGALRALFSLEAVNLFLLDGHPPEEAWVAGVVADSRADFARRGLGFHETRVEARPPGKLWDQVHWELEPIRFAQGPDRSPPTVPG